jgi:hydrogenase expression/formation protein HypD
MNPSDPTRSRSLSRLGRLASALGRDAAFMEVCGTHTMSVFRSGLRSLLPRNVKLLSGPGCPVCVTAQSDIDMLIALAVDHDVTVCTYGDMLRVPGARGSLERARGDGADVRVVYSSMDAVTLAHESPGRQVVFAAVGFETTAPATAAAVDRAMRLGLENFTVLASHKLVMPAVAALLDSGAVHVDGFLLPGHVSVITGWREFEPIARRYGLPCVVGGFEDEQIPLALADLVQMVVEGRAELVNQYPQAVSERGNPTALALMGKVFEVSDVRWRGLGSIPGSGLVLRDAYRAFDAQARFDLRRPEDREPKGCRCGEVITGAVTPAQCVLFDNGCTPTNPIGPCMVSSEGTCQAWFKYQRAGGLKKRRLVSMRRREPAARSKDTLEVQP